MDKTFNIQNILEPLKQKKVIKFAMITREQQLTNIFFDFGIFLKVEFT
jgi:hypothetical protein